jgi:hypothetical protein
MTNQSNFYCHSLHFDELGTYQRLEVQGINDMVARESITDLIVLSHGWNNDEIEAGKMYDNLGAKMQDAWENTTQNHTRRFGIVQIYWPSKQYNRSENKKTGVAASSGSTGQAIELFSQLDSLFTSEEEKKTLQEARTRIEDLEYSSSDKMHFLRCIQKLHKDTNIDPFDELLVHFEPEKAGALFNLLEDIEADEFRTEYGVALSTDPIMKKIRHFVNLLTYYGMRERAHLIGTTGLNTVLYQLTQLHKNIKLHLVGHSFGALLVTSSVMGVNDQTKLEVDSLTLLQAAFSHFSFTNQYLNGRDGLFRPVLKLVKGPILISYSDKDSAVRYMYVIASALGGQVGLNVYSEFFGGLGSNGAKGLSDGEFSSEFSLLPWVTKYDFKSKKLYNLKASSLIENHSDICRIEVAGAIVSAIAAKMDS